MPLVLMETVITDYRNCIEFLLYLDGYKDQFAYAFSMSRYQKSLDPSEFHRRFYIAAKTLESDWKKFHGV